MKGEDSPAKINPIPVSHIRFGRPSLSLGPIKNTAIACITKAEITILTGPIVPLFNIPWTHGEVIRNPTHYKV